MLTDTRPITRPNDVHLTVEDTVFTQTEPRAGSTAPVTAAALAALPTQVALGVAQEPDILLAEDKTVTAALPCRVQDAELWFAETPAELEQAKAFCADCPVRQTCLAGALARREPWGVWGGEIFERGAVIARKRPRGRPRKADRDVAA